MNLLEETIDAIQHSGHSIQDVDWVGAKSFGWFDWDAFSNVADVRYDSGYGGQEVASDLIVHFSDDTYLRRMEYDGSEWWEYQRPMARPDNMIIPRTVCGGMWDTLYELNSGE